MQNLSSNRSDSSLSSGGCLLPEAHIFALIPLNIVSSIIGTVGNTLVIATVYTNAGMQTISNYWLASMAVADLMVSALGLPLLMVFWGLQLNDECNQPVSETFRLVGNMSCSASVLHLCFISIDRCILIVRPLDCHSIRTMKRLKFALVIAWTLPVGYGILRITVSKKATSYLAVFAAALCYFIIISCNTLIIIKVWNRDTETLKTSVRSRRSAARLIERRVTVTVAIVVVVFTICWFPLMYLRAAYAKSNVGVAYNWARTLALGNSAMNPCIYCFRMGDFRAAYEKLLRCRIGPCKRDTSDQYEVNRSRVQSSDWATASKYRN